MASPNLSEVARLELINYQALVPVADVTPGLDLTLREDVILTSSQVFPAPDTTHACLLRAGDEAADSLLAEIIGYFRERGLPTHIYLSPACTPSDLADRLRNRGFEPHEHTESWVVLDDLAEIEFRSQRDDLELQPVGADEALIFAQTFLSAFEQPDDFAPYLAEMFKPSMGLPTAFHFLARLDGQPIGTASLVICEQHGIIGSTGILPEYRKTKAGVELFRAVYAAAQQQQVTTLFAQTRTGSTAEQLMLANNFRRAFVRQGFTLDG